jgi:hypothetical protein
MKVTSALLALAFSTQLQRAPSPQALLQLQRPLTAAEMGTVVSGIRQALTGMTLRLRESRGADREILMGLAGEMVRQYVLNSATQTWTVTASSSVR